MADAERQGEETRPYRVVAIRCHTFYGSGEWAVAGPDGALVQTHFGGKEFADNTAALMNMAFDAGRKSVLTPPTTGEDDG